LKFAVAVGLLFGLVVVIVAAAGGALWSRFPAELRASLGQALNDDAGLVLLFSAFLLVTLGLLVDVGFKAYVRGMNRLAEGARIILTANPMHRLPDDGPDEAVRLAAAINGLADRYQSALADVEMRVQEANATLEEEKHRLAALMSEHTDCELVCNREGLILLYNAAARSLFNRPEANDGTPSGIVGLGRSVFGIIDERLIAHALDIVRERLNQGEARPVSQFVTTIADGKLMRARMAPVLGAAEGGRRPEITGFVLSLDDVTSVVRAGEQRDRLVQSLAEDTRAGLASIRAAVEAIIEYGHMEPDRREEFTAIIRDEAVRLSDRLDTTLASYGNRPLGPWPLEAMQSDDLLRAIQRSLERRAGVNVTAKAGGGHPWLKVDSFAVVQAFTSIAGRLQQEFGIREFTLKLSPGVRFAILELSWRSSSVDPAQVGAWDTESFGLADGLGRLSLRDVAQRHGGEQWCHADHPAGRVGYCLQLPIATYDPAAAGPALDGDRPVFYDFDLFHRPGQTKELGRRPLSELVYTVFDTETTGLDPSAGDEIISISAARIVNGRLLRQESFDQLVDPRRPLSKESIRIHGITPRMLEGQPTIDQVLPRFARFAEDTVLIGHNVAFDMRFLQMKERQTGQRFIQPVLDTLLLSAVVHPNLYDHELEANARRLGVTIIGRHTSLGDAILTGEIFIKLIPLLAGQGIVTLEEALTASQRTDAARVSY
jgi:DNA polymerase-3 subunit epsilon